MEIKKFNVKLLSIMWSLFGSCLARLLFTIFSCAVVRLEADTGVGRWDFSHTKLAYHQMPPPPHQLTSLIPFTRGVPKTSNTSPHFKASFRPSLPCLGKIEPSRRFYLNWSESDFSHFSTFGGLSDAQHLCVSRPFPLSPGSLTHSLSLT